MLNNSLGKIKSIGAEEFSFTPKGVKGYAIVGPYHSLPAGNYKVEFGFADVDPDHGREDDIVAIVDVTYNFGRETVARREILHRDLTGCEQRAFALDFSIKSTENMEFRVLVTGARDLATRLRRRISFNGKSIDFPPTINEAPAQDARHFSPYLSLDRAIIDGDGKVPMFWVTGHSETSFGNFGDALSPVVVEALSGLSSHHQSPNESLVRLVTAGTVLNWQESGYIHVWGTGLDPAYDHSHQLTQHGYKKPRHLNMRVHAVRGALTRKTLLDVGIDCPAVFGDPGWLLPKIVPPSDEKTYELGIIPHISDFESQTPTSSILERLKRYDIGNESGIKIISTRHAPTWEGFVDKIREITSCQRIISTSFHGLIVPQAYGIPAILFSKKKNDCLGSGDLLDEYSHIDHRVRDFMLGAGYTSLPMYSRCDSEMTDWDDVIKSIDKAAEPVIIDATPFIESFPLHLLPPEKRWRITGERAGQIRF
ncbi:polysaccharide pyruvyl transferase family protein [Paraburkholderia dioscoreae]|uniref:Polysaccharide pyruvyl transferase domain-containing protein n=1 Tax=Paraburkholderia dioscoreae TaxID=2604047 RepID=A0A5Q4ZIA2_9BURK|nr:polysaccharide pyruvyl transferase family protein [Paraburkholderia dioscoreae]VVD31147.1 protein of unknown function [Paraburkholderia dioscoreae]